MATAERFEDLQVWQGARALVSKIYAVTRTGEFAKDFGLRDQIRRAAVSVMSNVAEGFDRRTDNFFQHFLAIAKGSAGEVRSQLYVALDQNYITEAQFNDCSRAVVRVGKMLTNLIQYLRTSDSKFPRAQS
ncbi:MAG: four helix bundle protein [Kiritimatiellae bacterium]|nr:four helix bundle protein [Kiritimatiellia bacterium]